MAEKMGKKDREKNAEGGNGSGRIVTVRSVLLSRNRIVTGGFGMETRPRPLPKHDAPS